MRSETVLWRALVVAGCLILASVAEMMLDGVTASGVPPYLTFYPAVMAAALLAGFWPGVLVVLVADLASAYWLGEQTAGTFAVGTAVNYDGVVLFTGTSLIMCLIAKIYQTRHQHAVASDLESVLHESEVRLADFAEATLAGSVEITTAICQAKEEWERIFDSVPDLIAVMDADHRIIRVNRAMAERLGAKPADCVGQACFMKVHGSTLPPGFCPHMLTMSDHVVHEAEIYEPALGGHFLVTTNPLVDADGNMYATVHVARDITRQKLIEKQLRDSQEQLEMFVKHAPVALAMFDREMRYLYVSQRWLSDYQLEGQELRGVSHYDVFPSIPENWKEIYRRCLAGEVFRENSEIVARADGSVQWIRWEARPWYEQPEQVGGIVVFSEDITMKHQADEVLTFLGLYGADDAGENFFQGLARFLAETLKMDFICIDRLENDNRQARTLTVFHDGQFEDNITYDLKDTPCGEVVGRNICCYQDNVCSKFPDVALLVDLQAESYLGVTLWSTNGEPIGLIAVIGRQPLANSWLAESILQMVAIRAAAELERLLGDEALSQQEERQRLALEAARMASWEWHVQSGRVVWNEQHFRMLGYAPDEVVPSYQAWQERLHPDDAAAAETVIRSSMTERRAYVAGFRTLWPDGTIRYLEARGDFEYDMLGQPLRCYGVMLDITERMLIHESLEESEQRFRDIVATSADWIWEINAEGVYVFASPSVTQALGYTPDEILGHTAFDLMPAPESERVRNQFMTTLHQGAHFRDLENACLHKDGTLRYMLTSGAPFYDNKGQLKGYRGVDKDITERKRADEVLRRAHDELEVRVLERTQELEMAVDILQEQIAVRRAAEENLEHSLHEVEDLYNRAPCGYHSFDRNGLLVRINDTELNWLGYERDEIIEVMKVTDLMSSESRQRFSSHLPDFVRGKTINDLRLHFIRKDRSVLPVLLNSVPIMDENGAFRMSRTTIYDITDLEHAEEMLQRQNLLYLTLSKTGKVIALLPDRDTLFQSICQIAVEFGGFLLAWVGLIHTENQAISTVEAYGTTDYLTEIQVSATDNFLGTGPTGVAVRNGTCSICNDFQHNSRTTAWHEQGRKYGFQASAAIALKEGGRVIGALTVYSGEKDFFDKHQEELLVQLGDDIAFALDNYNREKRRLDAEQTLREENLQRLRALEIVRQQEMVMIQQSRQAAMGEMIGNIAHQWRQPLNTLGLLTQRLGYFYDTPSFDKEFLDTSVEKSMEIIHYMSRTIDDFRNFFSTNREKAEFRLVDAVNQAVSLVEASFSERKIAIEQHGSDQAVIYGVRNEFAQVLLNILINAKDAITERNVAEPWVKISISAGNGATMLTVADNAGGIAAEVMEKIFDPYFTTKGPQLGTGIGLFMSKTIIENNMGGTLSVRNTEDGTEFRIEV
jgi:PAS domain S-box-containing protein